MPISLLTNAVELSISRSLQMSEQKLRQSMERLASGKRINHSYDDPAGLAIASHLSGKIRSLQQAQRNALDATSVIQVAEGGLNELDGMVVRMRELAIQAASDSMGDPERELLNLEVSELREEVDRIAMSTRYLGVQLLNGTARRMTFQIGPENTEFDQIEYEAGTVDVRSATLGLDDVSLEDQDAAMESLAILDQAVHRMQIPRSQLGALQGRLHSVSNYLTMYEESLTDAHSRIHDTDYAKESSNFLRGQVLQKAAIAVLSQANTLPQEALKLLDPR